MGSIACLDFSHRVLLLSLSHKGTDVLLNVTDSPRKIRTPNQFLISTFIILYPIPHHSHKQFHSNVYDRPSRKGGSSAFKESTTSWPPLWGTLSACPDWVSLESNDGLPNQTYCPLIEKSTRSESASSGKKKWWTLFIKPQRTVTVAIV